LELGCWRAEGTGKKKFTEKKENIKGKRNLFRLLKEVQCRKKRSRDETHPREGSVLPYSANRRPGQLKRKTAYREGKAWSAGGCGPRYIEKVSDQNKKGELRLLIKRNLGESRATAGKLRAQKSVFQGSS